MHVHILISSAPPYLQRGVMPTCSLGPSPQPSIWFVVGVAAELQARERRQSAQVHM